MDWERMNERKIWRKRNEESEMVFWFQSQNILIQHVWKHWSTLWQGTLELNEKSKLRSSKPKHVVLKAGLKAQLWSNWTRQQNLKLTSSIERPFRPATHQWPSSLYWQRRKATHIHAHTHTETLADDWDHTLRLSLLGQQKLVQSFFSKMISRWVPWKTSWLILRKTIKLGLLGKLHSSYVQKQTIKHLW